MVPYLVGGAIAVAAAASRPHAGGAIPVVALVALAAFHAAPLTREPSLLGQTGCRARVHAQGVVTVLGAVEG